MSQQLKTVLPGVVAGVVLLLVLAVGPQTAEILRRVEALRTYSEKLSGALLFLLGCTLCLGWFIRVTWDNRARFNMVERVRRWATIAVVFATIVVNFVEPGNGLAEALATSHIVLGFFHLQPS